VSGNDSNQRGLTNVVVNNMIQNVKNAAAVCLRPDIQYITTENIEHWNNNTGKSAVICAKQNAAG
jgi:hypothetical protein